MPDQDDGGGGGRELSRRRALASGQLRRVFGGVAVLVAFALAVLAGVVVALDQSLTRVDVEGLGGTEVAIDLPDDEAGDEGSVADELDHTSSLEVEIDHDAEPLTVLLLGSDSREVLTAQERRELGTGMAWGERTEVVALVRIDPAADELRMVNIPRDSVVTRCDGTRGRINAAYSIGERTGVGGVTCVLQSVRDWSGLGIDHALMVDFRGFLEIVDAIGGIEMYIDEPMLDRRANLDLQAGCQVLDGADALAFVRARGLDDDFGRISRQHRLLVEMRDQVNEEGVLSEPVRTLRFAEAVASSLQVDSTLTLNRIRRLVMDHRSSLQDPLETRTVPGTPDTSGEAWLLQPDEAAAAELFRWLLEGDREPDEPTTETEGRTEREDAPSGTGVSSSDLAGDGAVQGTDGLADQDPPEDEPPIGSQPRRCE
ncbi:MAG: hypothetical protein EA387_08490 [Nitriliruptor sp.]|nr:MAG: hypothetical protein EA387_08490 [Nitriliruptor sp.]